jgi:hypothetical protein
MTNVTTSLAAFFASWQHNRDTATTDNLAQFADTFLAAGPDGAKPVPAAAFGPALAKRRQLFAQLGCLSNELLSLDETPLDSRYTLARTRWRMTFSRPGLADEPFEVASTFLIDTRTQQILVYLAHQDILALLRERGLMAP